MTGYIKNDKVHVSASIPAIRLEGTETSAANLELRENAGNIELYDVTNDVVRTKWSGATGKRLTPLIATTEIANAAVTQAQIKIKTVVALADAAATLTAAQMIDSGVFTITPTVARILTTDTAANIVAALPAYQVGTWFDFTVINTAAFDVTLAAGTGITLSGATVLHAGACSWKARIDSATAVTVYNTSLFVTATGTGNVVRATSPTLVTPALGTPASGVLTNATGLPTAGLVDGAVTAAKLAADAVITAKILDANVTAVKIATDAVTTVKVLAKNITTAKVADAAITQAQFKIKDVVALADAAATLTAAELVDKGIFTITPTVARILTTDTAANIIAGLAGQQIGTWFDVTIQSLAAFDVTLAAGTDVTLSGKMILNDVTGTFKARITSATAVTIYRM